MARKPKNPINDIINQVGGWLGGRGPGTNPQVQAAMNATRAVGKVVDTATGGFGQALVSDAQRMAQTGSSTPSALYKTAAVNLAAAAAGAGAAKVAGKVVSKVVTNRATKATKAITPTNPDRLVYHAGYQENAFGPFDKNYQPVNLREGNTNIHMGDEGQAVIRQETAIGFDKDADMRMFRGSSIDRYEVVNKKAISPRMYVDNALYGEDAENQIVGKFVQTFDDIPTPKNKILKYINQAEGVGRPSYLIPKSRIDSGDVVYRGTKEFAQQFLDGPYTSPRLNQLRNIQSQIAAAQPRIMATGAVAGVAVPKKKARGGGKNKR